jgi:peptidoglycan/xylan/chitin deacetylase (PgdA/CDA1 family)
MLILFALTLGWAVFAGASTAAANTYVSLTFDDGNADQLAALPILADHDMDGTFYIITNRVGRPNSQYMSWSDVQTIYDDGNEIGGHTRDHTHLNDPTFTDAQIQDQICGGRQDLLARGYPQVSFAYPFGDHDARSEGFVQSCGYLSGRGVSGLQQATGEPDAESIPPSNQWVVRTRGSVDVDDTLPEIEDWIADAEAVDAGNGSADAWIPLVIHHLCDPAITNCADPNGVANQYITPSDFDSLLGFLESHESTGTHVLPIAQVMDANPPSSQITCNGAACQSTLYADPVSVMLSATDTGRSTGASGVQNIRYTTDGSNPTGSSPIYTGPINVSSTTTIKFRAEDNARNVESPVHSQTIQVSSPPQGGTLSALASSKSLPNGTAKLAFVLGGPGTLAAVDASGAGASAVAAKKHRARIRPASKSVAQAGSATLVIRTSKAGKRILRRKGKMTVPVLVTFTPLSGAPSSQTVKVKLRLKRHRGA